MDAATSFTDGTTNSFDFSTLPGGANLALGSASTGSIPATVQLKPDNTTHTLHFGGAGSTGTLTIGAPIVDFSASPTNVYIAPNSQIILTSTASTYTGITTIDGSLTVNSAQALGAGTGIDANGTVVNATGKLTTAAGVTLGNEKITINGGTLNISSSGPIVLNATSTLIGVYSGAISGPSGLNLPGVTTLTGSNTYGGLTTITGRGYRQLRHPPWEALPLKARSFRPAASR